MAWRIIAVLACMALLPVAYAAPLRFSYEQWFAHQLAKVSPPYLAVIGDSIAAGGGGYGRLDTINLASNGQTVRQISMQLPAAKALRPRWIMANGGVNDMLVGVQGTLEGWRAICREPNVIAVLPTPTVSAELNNKLRAVSAIIRAECKRTIDLSDLAGPDGLLKPEYSADGIHLTSAAYPIWRARLYQGLR